MEWLAPARDDIVNSKHEILTWMFQSVCSPPPILPPSQADSTAAYATLTIGCQSPDLPCAAQNHPVLCTSSPVHFFQCSPFQPGKIPQNFVLSVWLDGLVCWFSSEWWGRLPESTYSRNHYNQQPSGFVLLLSSNLMFSTELLLLLPTPKKLLAKGQYPSTL